MCLYNWQQDVGQESVERGTNEISQKDDDDDAMAHSAFTNSHGWIKNRGQKPGEALGGVRRR